MTTKNQRHQSVVSREGGQAQDENHWLSQFEKSLQKEAVQPVRVDQSMFEQINSIMNGKSKYPSVAAAVEDMKSRSGLTDYLKKMSKVSSEEISEGTPKTASEIHSDTKNTMTPSVIVKCPTIKNTFENYIRDTKGSLSIPAIIERIKSIHSSDVSESKDWDEDKLAIFVSNLNLKAKKDNPEEFRFYHNLGSIERGNTDDADPANTDSFHSLQPAT